MNIISTLSLLICITGELVVSNCTQGFTQCSYPNVTVCIPSSEPWCAKPLWLNPYADPVDRANALLKKMTLKQKVANMGNMYWLDSAGVADLGYPPFATAECLHGYFGLRKQDGEVTYNATQFPHSTTLAASFNRELLFKIATAISNEARGFRNAYEAGKLPIIAGLACWAPQINIVRDPRWGRNQETYGECPYLTGELAAEYVSGLQGSDPKYLRAIATPKHFDAYGGATTKNMANRSITEVYISYQTQFETFLPQFRRVMRENPGSIMCGYNSICHSVTSRLDNTTCAAPSHGVPTCASNELLQDIARDRFGFDGYVVGDCGAIRFIETDHKYAKNKSEAAALALLAGADFDCNDQNYSGFWSLENATFEGLVKESDVDRGMRRIILAQISLGTMDPPAMVPFTKIPFSIVLSKPHLDLSAQAAREGVVLLRNDINLLPIDKGDYGKVAMIGPNGELECSGNYNGPSPFYITMKDGFRKDYPHMTFSPGCASGKDIFSNDTSGFDEALRLSAAADLIIGVFGINSKVEHETGTKKTLVLPGVQNELIQALVQLGKPFVLVLTGGSAMIVPEVVKTVVFAGYGSMFAGDAVADVVFGRYNPSGKLPYTFYESDNQLPPYENYDMREGVGRTYRFLKTDVQFRFGHGLSYTKFEYSWDSAIDTTISPCMSLTVSFVVENVGEVAGTEISFVFVSLPAKDAPVIELRGFERNYLEKHQKIKVQLKVGAEAFATASEDETKKGQWLIRPGDAVIWIGGQLPGRGVSMLKGVVHISPPVTDLELCDSR